MKKGLMLPNSVGIIDQDYRGENDEIMIQVYNLKDQPVEVQRGERLAQGIFVKIAQVDWAEVSEMSAASRGGFGSSG
jgi:dUTP pyrophosphatase